MAKGASRIRRLNHRPTVFLGGKPSGTIRRSGGMCRARIGANAARAGMNERLLFRCFGDQEAIHATVPRAAWFVIREGGRALSLGGLPPETAIATPV